MNSLTGLLPMRSRAAGTSTCSPWPLACSSRSSQQRLSLWRVVSVELVRQSALPSWLLAAYFALRRHHVYYAARENTTITAMASFVHRRLPSDWPPDRKHAAPRAHPRVTPTAITQLACTWRSSGTAIGPLHGLSTMPISSFTMRPRKRLLLGTLLSGALPRKCLVLRLEDPQQTSGGTGPGRLAQEVRAVSDRLSLGIRSARQPFLPQELPQLIGQR